MRLTEVGGDSPGNTAISPDQTAAVSEENRVNLADREVPISKPRCAKSDRESNRAGDNQGLMIVLVYLIQV